MVMMMIWVIGLDTVGRPATGLDVISGRKSCFGGMREVEGLSLIHI